MLSAPLEAVALAQGTTEVKDVWPVSNDGPQVTWQDIAVASPVFVPMMNLSNHLPLYTKEHLKAPGSYRIFGKPLGSVLNIM